MRSEQIFRIDEETILFFEKHAGTSYQPATETKEEGKRRGAIELAVAEAWGKSVGLTVEWTDDWQIDHEKEFDCYNDGGPSTCETATAYVDGEIVAVLGCVDDASDEYRRVVEAELAQEAMDNAPNAEIADATAIFPMPGATYSDQTVVASVHYGEDDEHMATVVLLNKRAPFYTVAVVRYAFGTIDIIESYDHENIVNAINGNEYPHPDPDRPTMMIGPRRPGYVDLGGDV